MNAKAKARTYKKAFVVFLFVLSVLTASGRNGLPFEEPPAKDSTSATDDVSAVSKDIQQTIKGLEYSDDIDTDLVQIVSLWRYMDWRQTLSRARQDYQQKKTSAQQLAQVEEEVLKELCQAIRKEFSIAPSDSEYFYLSKVVKDRTAQCLGYSQLLYVLGNSLGLTIKVVDVLESAAGPLPAGEEHAACLVELTGGKVMMVDLTQDTVGKAFIFRKQYTAIGNYWELTQKDNPLKIPRRIQIMDRKGLVADIYNNQGNAYAKSEKDSDAISFLTKAIELNPKLAKAYGSRGVVLFKKGQRTKAISDLDKATELDPKNAEAYYSLGCIYSGSGQDAKVISNFTKAIELKPMFAAAYKKRGVEYSKLGQNTEAISDFSKSIELDPKDAEPYFLRGLIYNQSAQYAKAIAEFTKAIEIDPKLSDAYNDRGVSYSRLGKYTDAISDFIKATELNPKYANAYYNRGIVYGELEQNDQAVSYYTKAIEINPKYIGAYINRGTIYFKLGQYANALADFNKAIRLNPKNAETYYNRGLANLGLKKNEEAKRDLLKAAELNPAMKEKVKKILDKLKKVP